MAVYICCSVTFVRYEWRQKNIDSASEGGKDAEQWRWQRVDPLTGSREKCAPSGR